MNKVILIGNLCKDNEVKVIQGTDKKVIRNSIAVKRNFKNSEGNYDSDFINIVVYEPSANFMSQYTSKGDKVAISGRWNHRTWKDEYNVAHYADECVVDNIELLAKPQNKSATTNAVQPEPAQENNPFSILDDDLPF